MSDNKFARALEYCLDAECYKCPLREDNNCRTNLVKAIIDLINRYEAEIEELKKLLQSRHIAIEFLEGRIISLPDEIRAESVEEFAERLKGIYINDKRYDRPNPHTLLIKLFANIDNLKKEMLKQRKEDEKND